jgi:hypothetical protein
MVKTRLAPVAAAFRAFRAIACMIVSGDAAMVPPSRISFPRHPFTGRKNDRDPDLTAAPRGVERDAIAMPANAQIDAAGAKLQIAQHDFV